MVLIACPECTREISDTAPTCPGCGFAINPVVSKTPAEQVRVANTVTKERTAKSLKAIKLFGIACFWIGLIQSFRNDAQLGDGSLAIDLLVGGFLIWILTKIAIYWEHG